MQDLRKPVDMAAWTGFLLMAFAVVGLIGAFATYAAQLPFDRAMARCHTLDLAEHAAAGPNPIPALEALRPLLGDSAAAILTHPASVPSAAHAERQRVLSQAHAESLDYGFRLRIVIAAFTAAAALFGSMVLSIVRARS